MEGTKIKNIVIVILLLLNGFLLFLVGGRWFEDSHSHESARSSAIQVIRNSGVILEESAVPKEMSLTPMQAQRDLERENKLAEGLLGGGITVEALGGEVYRYTGEHGWIQFHSTGEFMAEFEAEAFPVSGEPARYAAAMLSTLDFDGQVLEDTVVDAAGEVTFRQMLGETPLLGCQATVHCRDGRLVSITQGRRLLGEPRKTVGEESMSIATALMRLYNGLKDLGDIYTRIESITPAYTMRVSISGPVRLDPVWYVKTDTGSYQMDTHTGRISRVGSAVATADAQIALTEG